MASKNDTLTLVRARREEIAAHIDRLHKEDEELAVTEKVLLRISGMSDALDTVRRDTNGKDNGVIIKNTFTVADGILKALAGGSGQKKQGVTAGEILSELQKTWFPTLARTSFSPQLSRLCHRKKVIRTRDGLYYLP